jgi:hypothetical protein
VTGDALTTLPAGYVDRGLPTNWFCALALLFAVYYSRMASIYPLITRNTKVRPREKNRSGSAFRVEIRGLLLLMLTNPLLPHVKLFT